MTTRTRWQQLDQRGFALIITVITLALLTIIAVAFLSSSTMERATSRAAVNRVKAELAAKAAVDVAIARLVDNFTQYPDSATTWETLNGNPATILYYRDQAPEVAIASGTAAKLNVLPLISGGTAQLASAKTTSFPALDDTNSFDLNHARFSGDTQGWIGAPPSSSKSPLRGQWVDSKDTDGKVTGRYAYWMEDEAFKANVNQLGKTPRGSNSLGAAPTEIPLQGIIKAVLPTADAESLAGQVYDFRNGFRKAFFFEQRDLNHVPGEATLGDDTKFETTIQSAALNLSRSGSMRVNLNNVVKSSIDATEIRKQLDRIIATINYQLPNFGQRFYRLGADKNALDVSGSGTPDHRTIYLNKLAANIRDYIDSDSQPTIVNNDPTLSIRIGSAPTNAVVATGGLSGQNEVVAIGKERVPLIQEYALRVRQIAFSPRTGPFASYTIAIDHYVEIWNSSNKPIQLSDLGSNPFLLIANQPGWDAAGLDDIPEGKPRDLKLDLSTAKRVSDGSALVSFPAGDVVAITTDPTLLPALTPTSANVYYIAAPASLRTYSGRTQKKSSSELRLNLKTRTTTSSDYETEIVFGNDTGLLESGWGAGAITATISVNIDNTSPPENHLDDTKFHFRGASLRGNSAAAIPYSTSGDPRTNAEQIKMDLNGSTAGNDRTRYFDSGLDSKNIPGNSSLGAPNSKYVDTTKWPDVSSNGTSADTAPALIANAPLTSIGQLGDVFDPARVKGDSNDVTLSRGGGRTLKVGQPDAFSTTNPAGLWDSDSKTPSREWTAWRLADVFSTNDAVQLDGRININGVNRDDGSALKAALYGYAFAPTPDCDSQIASQSLSDTQVAALINQVQSRLKNQGPFTATEGPFAERGELSEMPVFDSTTTLTGKDMSSVNDRGREELFRRLAELITTRGNIFTVYAIGQSLVPATTAGGPPVITSTSQLKVTFRIDPVWTAGVPNDSFDPASPAARFKKPDRYAVKIIHTSS